MQEPEINDRDWVTEEAEALLASDPTLRASIERQMEEQRNGTLGTVPDAVVRARMAELRAAHRQGRTSG